jgi:hypothetical protein
MVQRFAHLAVGHLVPYADTAGIVIANGNLGTLWAQSKSAAPEPAKESA